MAGSETGQTRCQTEGGRVSSCFYLRFHALVSISIMFYCFTVDFSNLWVAFSSI